jgi:hypothetical protein
MPHATLRRLPAYGGDGTRGEREGCHCGDATLTVHFKDTSSNKITSLEYEKGAVIPKSGDHIVSPFNADWTALVSAVTGDGKRNPFSVLCAEQPVCGRYEAGQFHVSVTLDDIYFGVGISTSRQVPS